MPLAGDAHRCRLPLCQEKAVSRVAAAFQRFHKVAEMLLRSLPHIEYEMDVVRHHHKLIVFESNDIVIIPAQVLYDLQHGAA